MKPALLALLLSAIPAAATAHSRPAVAALVYHHFLTDEQARARPRLLDEMTMSRRQLVEQLDYLKSQSAHFLTLDEFLLHVKGEKEAPPRSVLIVIDDGYESVYKIAWPVLKERAIPATLALIVLPTDDPTRWSTAHKGASPHLSWAQLSEMMQSKLVSLASHTFDRHQNLRAMETALKPDDRPAFYRSVQEDLAQARSLISTRTKNQSTGIVLVWPHGASSPHLLQAAQKAGYVATFGDLGQAIPARSTPWDMTRVHAGSGLRSIPALARSLREAGWQ